jgi:hypothetical protein
MKRKSSKSKVKAVPEPAADPHPGVVVSPIECPPREAFLAEARKEPKRKLLLDHSATITMLRDEKSFTFREIAEWFCKRGFQTDHSAVYRAYLSAVPEENRNPTQDWSDVDQPE